MFLETLESWTERNRSDLESAGVTVSLSEATQWDKPSQGLLLSAPGREAEILVWSSGECEVFVGNPESPDLDVEQVHHDLASVAELIDLLDACRIRFATIGQ